MGLPGIFRWRQYPLPSGSGCYFPVALENPLLVFALLSGSLRWVHRCVLLFIRVVVAMDRC